MPYRQAIQTKYLGPTNYRGARIRATAQSGSVTIPYPHELNITDAHDRAALALVAKNEWWGRWARGGSPDGRGLVYVWVEDLLKGEENAVIE